MSLELVFQSAIKQEYRKVIKILLTHVTPSLDDLDSAQSNVILSILIRSRKYDTIPGALHKACRQGDKLSIQLLLTTSNIDSIHQGATPLTEAIRSRNPDIVSFLLEQGAKPNQAGVLNQSLPLAAFWGPSETLELLLKHGADIDAKTTLVGSALDVATQFRDDELVMWLTKNGAARTLETLHIAVIHDNYSMVHKMMMVYKQHVQSLLGFSTSAEMVDTLVSYGADVNAQGEDGCTMLTTMVMERPVAVYEAYLKQGAVVDVDDCGTLAAAYMNDRVCTDDDDAFAAMQLLIKFDADVNKSDTEGNTPLYTAASKFHLKTMQLLLDNGAQLHPNQSQTSDSLSKFCARTGTGHHDWISRLTILQKAGASFEEDDLMAIIDTPHIEASLFLLESVADDLSDQSKGEVIKRLSTLVSVQVAKGNLKMISSFP